MIGLLDQNISPSPWAQDKQQTPPQMVVHRSNPPSSSSHGSATNPMKGLDAMDEEIEDEEIQLPLRDDDCDVDYKNYEPMDYDYNDMDCDDEKGRVIRERRRTISIKLKETVEAFRRMQSGGFNNNGRHSNGSTSSSSGGEISLSPNRNPKLSNKMSSTESGVESYNGEPQGCSRRESLSVYGAEAKREYMRPRRQTITSKWPPSARRGASKLAATGIPPPPLLGSSHLSTERKSSNDSQFIDDEMELDEDFPPTAYKGRRFSVPEKVLREADFAIFRQKDHVVQCLRAFSKNDEPLKEYMQSRTCYDVAPLHNAVCVVDGALSVKKAVIAYCSTGLVAALVINTTADDTYDILTLTDCLEIFRTVSKNPALAEIKLRDFYAKHLPNRKKIIYSPTTQSVWDIARLFRMNRVHRIPVVHTEEGGTAADQPNLLYFISLRLIFSECIFKLLDTKCVIFPNFNQLKIKDTKFGTWSNIIQAHENTPLGELVDIILEHRISCLPIHDDDGFISGIITKQDIMYAVGEYKNDTFSAALTVPAYKMCKENCLDFLVTTDCTVEGACRTLYDSWLPCLFVVDNSGEKVIGIISYADIMDFLFKMTDNPQHLKTAASNGIRSRINSIAQE